MVTTGDDKISDYLSKTGVQTLEGRQSNVFSAVYRSTLPIIDISSKGGIVYITAWVHSNATVVLSSLNSAGRNRRLDAEREGKLIGNYIRPTGTLGKKKGNTLSDMSA